MGSYDIFETDWMFLDIFVKTWLKETHSLEFKIEENSG